MNYESADLTTVYMVGYEKGKDKARDEAAGRAVSGHDTDKKTDVEWVNLVDAVRALKAARTGIVNARESLQHHQGALKDAESAVYKALVGLGERRVVLGDELVELYDHPGESLVRIVPTLVAP